MKSKKSELSYAVKVLISVELQEKIYQDFLNYSCKESQNEKKKSFSSSINIPIEIVEWIINKETKKHFTLCDQVNFSKN
jgi:hypothetical protein